MNDQTDEERPPTGDLWTETTADDWQTPADAEPPEVAPRTDQEDIAPLPYAAETTEETVRRSGMAWSAGIAFFASVAFCLFLGWIADWLLGTSPWGIVAGIVLGSLIGFMQFFRISSRIFRKQDTGPTVSPLMGRSDDNDGA